jgi:transcription termination/antitermination protein NusG
MLEEKGVENFLPLYRTRKKWADRMKTLDLPLFPGYLFGRFDAKHRFPIMSTSGVLGVVGNGRQLLAVETSEIDAIRRLLASGLECEPWKTFVSGDPVRIDDGPLRGLNGTVIKVSETWKLVVSVSLLRRSVLVTVDRDWVTPLSLLSRIQFA